jgi:hypothetical protein
MTEETADETEAVDSKRPDIMRRHVVVGWWLLLVFLTLGIVLESLHGFKIGWYLEIDNETRRLMLTLAHAHGTLLGIVNIVFGLTAGMLPNENGRLRRIASPMLIASNLLLPLGFIFGGLYFYGGDPGLGAVILVPAGAMFLFLGTLLAVLDVTMYRQKD